MSFLEARGIVKSYPVGGAELTVLRDLDLQVAAGEMVAIVGASGVGKSTLLHLLGGLDRADRGSVAIAGQDLAALADEAMVAFRNRHVGFVFQFHHLLPEFTAVENAEIERILRGLPPVGFRPHSGRKALRQLRAQSKSFAGLWSEPNSGRQRQLPILAPEFQAARSLDSHVRSAGRTSRNEAWGTR